MSGFAASGPYERFFDRELHGEALATLASAQISAGQPEAAFRSADRRLRLGSQRARDFLLRAEALRRLGLTGPAKVDLAAAIEADPAAAEVNLAAMRWGDAAAREDAARRLIAGDVVAPAAVAEAVGVLFAAGERLAHRVARFGAGFRGWVAWASRDPLELRITHEGRTTAHGLAPDPECEIAGHASAEFEIPQADAVEMWLHGRLLAKVAAPAKTPRTDYIGSGGELLLSVIVPIHGDLEATRACLASLIGPEGELDFRLILVDDAAPDPELRALVEVVATLPGVLRLRNEVNLGFSASVNRALAICGADDVVLLNADTLVPEGALRRLADVAHSQADIGTVTPFSNNGEETSFPQPGVANALPDPAGVAQIDASAWRANGLGAVDLVNGIGFCLYIKRACLDAVGGLKEIYRRGYYEDVEFCLAARERGFRNVCATGVYVGHAGSRSFQAEKRALVMRNLAVLQARFPRYLAQSAAFDAADPLSGARAAIEALFPPAGPLLVILSGPGRAAYMAEARARDLLDEAAAPTILTARVVAGEHRVELRRAGPDGPKSLDFPLSEAGLARLRAYLGAAHCLRWELFDATGVPSRLLQAIDALGAPMEVVAADLQAFLGARVRSARACAAAVDAAPCEACLADFATPAPSQSEDEDKRIRLALALAMARAVRPLDRMGEAFARRVFGDKALAVGPAPERVRKASSGGALGVLSPLPSAASQRLLLRLARLPAFRTLDIEIIVIGRCLDDLEIMASGPVFVTGPAAPREYEALVERYRIGPLASFDRSAFFGPLDRLRGLTGARMAYFDASFGALAAEAGDLALDPRLCDAKAASAIALWLGSDYTK